MSAEPQNLPAAAEAKPEGGEIPAVGAGESEPTASTSKANEAAAEGQTAPTTGDKAEGDEAAKTADTTEAEPSGATVVAPDSTPASAKKSKDSKKRRSSTGIPEHKAKKPAQKKKGPELQLNAEPGDLFLATMKGYPKWPAIICDDEMLPETLLANRPVTARRPDGTYRDDFLEGGKNARDRTYPVMYLGTYEFSWMVNIALSPLTAEEAAEAKTEKMTKGLQMAYAEAKEDHGIEYYKKRLVEYQQAAEEAAAEAAAKKAKTPKKSKKKAEDKVDDEDEEMADADAEPPKSTKSSSKKRKADAEDEGDAGKKKMKLNLNKGAKTPKADFETKAKTPKAKTPKSDKKSAAKAKEPQVSEKEKHERKKQATLYCRHKLQKAFLTTNTPPKDDDMPAMAKFFEQLEKADDIDGAILRDTKIHKVMKGIVKLPGDIPRESEFHFKERSQKLLDNWSKLLGESTEKPKPAATNGEHKDEAAPDSPAKEEEKEEAEKKEEATEPVEQVTPGDDAKDEAMPDAGAEKPAEAEAPTENGVKDEAAAEEKAE